MDVNWAGVVVDAVAATATLSAVLAAFIIQRMQAKADRDLDLRHRDQIKHNAAFACLNAVKAVRFADMWARELGAKSAADTAESLERANAVLIYYLDQEIADLRLVEPMVRTRILLSATIAEVDRILSQGTKDNEITRKVRLLQVLEARKGSIEYLWAVVSHLNDVYWLNVLNAKQRKAHPASRAAKAESEAR